MASTSDRQSIDHPTSKLLLSVILVETVLGTIIFFLRTYTKFCITREAGKWSYFWIALSWIGGILNCVFVSLSVSYGLGVHIQLLDEGSIVQAIKWSWVSDASSRLAVAFGRTSVIAFVYEMQGKHARRWQKGLLWSLALYNLIISIFCALIMFLRCTPPSYVWDKSIPGGRCPLETFNGYFAYVVASTGGASDLILIIYPLYIIWRLQMPRQVKIGISIMLSMGLLACVCAAMLTYNLYTVSATVDPTYVLTPITIWAVTEMWVILMAASVPQLRPLLRKASNRIRGTNSAPSQGKSMSPFGGSAARISSEPLQHTKSDSDRESANEMEKGVKTPPKEKNAWSNVVHVVPE